MMNAARPFASKSLFQVLKPRFFSSKIHFPSVSIHASVQDISDSIEQAKAGCLFVQDLPRPDFAQVRDTFDYLSSSRASMLTNGLNKAYSKNLVYKDSRLKTIEKNDPNLLKHHPEARFSESLDYWESLRQVASAKLLHAVASATGSPEVLDDAAFNYRMVDYYPRTHEGPPRCGEHRDFGTFTLIMSSSPGLEIFHNGVWSPIPKMKDQDNAIMLFGWCTQIRSNGRIPAVLHRVSDQTAKDDNDRRRNSMVLFCAPKQVDTRLEPVIRDGEHPQYISGVKVGQLRGSMAAKWRYREGTLNAQDKMLEEHEIRTTVLKTQDDVVKHKVAAMSG